MKGLLHGLYLGMPEPSTERNPLVAGNDPSKSNASSTTASDRAPERTLFEQIFDEMRAQSAKGCPAAIQGECAGDRKESDHTWSLGDHEAFDQAEKASPFPFSTGDVEEESPVPKNVFPPSSEQLFLLPNLWALPTNGELEPSSKVWQHTGFGHPLGEERLKTAFSSAISAKATDDNFIETPDVFGSFPRQRIRTFEAHSSLQQLNPATKKSRADIEGQLPSYLRQSQQGVSNQNSLREGIIESRDSLTRVALDTLDQILHASFVSSSTDINEKRPVDYLSVRPTPTFAEQLDGEIVEESASREDLSPVLDRSSVVSQSGTEQRVFEALDDGRVLGSRRAQSTPDSSLEKSSEYELQTEPMDEADKYGWQAALEDSNYGHETGFGETKTQEKTSVRSAGRIGEEAKIGEDTASNRKGTDHGIRLFEGVDRLSEHEQPSQSSEARMVNNSRFVRTTSQVLQQMIRHAETRIQGEISTVSMKLQPERLGKIQLKVVVEQGVVIARLVAQSEEVKALIESALPDLRQSLDEQGMVVDQLWVDVEGDGPGSGPFGESPSYQTNHPKSIDPNQREYARETIAHVLDGVAGGVGIDLLV